MLVLALAVSSAPPPAFSAGNATYKAFPQVWGEPWCRENCTQPLTQAECELAASTVDPATWSAPSSTNIASAALPSCMGSSPNSVLRWNKYGLNDKAMTTKDWLGFIAICTCAPPVDLYICVDNAICKKAPAGQGVPKDQCIQTCPPPSSPIVEP